MVVDIKPEFIVLVISKTHQVIFELGEIWNFLHTKIDINLECMRINMAIPCFELSVLPKNTAIVKLLKNHMI